MKTAAWVGAVVTFLSCPLPVVHAGPMPVPITLNYTASAGAHAMARVDTMFPGFDDQGGVDDTWPVMREAVAYAHAFASGWNETPDPYTPTIEWHYASADMASRVGAQTTTTGVTLTTSFVAMASRDGWGATFADGIADLQGTLVLGTSSQFPAGAPGLVLTVDFPQTDPGSMDFNHSLRLWSEDPENPLDITLDRWQQTAVLPLRARQSVNIILHNDAQMLGGWNDEDLTHETTLTLTPEPATLSLLALGGLAVLRRRRR